MEYYLEDMESFYYYDDSELIDWDSPLDHRTLRLLLHEAYLNSNRYKDAYSDEFMDSMVHEALANKIMDSFCELLNQPKWQIFKEKHLGVNAPELTREAFKKIFRRLWRNDKVRKQAHLIPIYIMAHFGLPLVTCLYHSTGEDYVTFHVLIDRGRFRSQRLYEILSYFKRHQNKRLMFGVN
jgi:hypothetical protein